MVAIAPIFRDLSVAFAGRLLESAASDALFVHISVLVVVGHDIFVEISSETSKVFSPRVNCYNLATLEVFRLFP